MSDGEQSADGLAAWCSAMAQLLNLPIDKADGREVIANLRVLAAQMELVGSFGLDEREDPAPQFRA
ncbi:MAG: DUF4089 domain-containing protein [Beijerinckiaceae bacterium]